MHQNEFRTRAGPWFRVAGSWIAAATIIGRLFADLLAHWLPFCLLNFVQLGHIAFGIMLWLSAATACLLYGTTCHRLLVKKGGELIQLLLFLQLLLV